MDGFEPRRSTLLVATGALVLAMGGSALAVGAVHLSVLVVVSTVAIGSCTYVVYRERSHVRLPAPAYVLFALAAWSTVQATPLPSTLLTWIAHRNADIWGRCLRPFGESGPAWASISLDPGATVVETLKWLTYGLTFSLAYWVTRWNRRPVVIWLGFGSAVTIAVVTLGHGLIGASALFGVYTPEQAIPRWGIPPILNPNNLSAYLNLGTFCGLGLLLAHRSSEEERPTVRRGVVGCGLAIVVAVSVLAASRAGVLGLALGMMLFIALVWMPGQPSPRGRKKLSDHSKPMSAVIAVVGGVVLAVVGASKTTWTELSDANTEKLRIAEWSIPLVRDFPLFGVGRGAFESVFPAYRPPTGHIVYAYPENFVVQWITEWGAPAALIAVITLVAMFRRGAHGSSSTVRTGAWVGIGILLLQNIVDLALEVPAIAILTSATLGSLYREPARDEASSSPEGPRSTGQRRRRRDRFPRLQRRALAIVVATSGFGSLFLALWFGRYHVDDERRELQGAHQALRYDDGQMLTSFHTRLREAVMRHPAEPYFVLLGAIVANRTKVANPMPWVGAAIERDPVNGRAHLVLAEVLAARGMKGQALMELRFAAEYEPSLVALTAPAAVRLADDVETLERAAPEGSKGAMALLSIAGALRTPEKREIRLTLLEHAIARDPESASVRISHANEFLSRIADQNAPCGPSASDRNKCRLVVRRDADAIRQSQPTSCQPLILDARALESEGNVDAAERLLAGDCGSCKDDDSCSGERVRLAANVGGNDRLVEAIRAYLSLACSHNSHCERGHMFVADTFAARNEWATAAEHYAEAATLVASDPDIWLRTADAALRAGDVVRASHALTKAQTQGGQNVTLERRILERRDALRREVAADRQDLYGP